MCGFRINNIIIDISSSANVLFNGAYERMALMLPKKLKPYDHELYRFNSALVKVRGMVSFPVELEYERHVDKHEIDFLVVDLDSPYIAILG